MNELLDQVLDARSFESWDVPIDIAGHSAEYQEKLRAAALKAGTDESVVTGRGLVRGRPVAVVVNEFRFLAGSIGVSAARRIASAVRRATAERLPILAFTSSGGTRMQEGTPAFVQMVEISRAIMDHRRSGLPYLVYLRHPTTGGVYASWGSLGQLTLAEPNALIGFLGPKVVEALTGRPFPPGVQCAENLAAKAVIDAVVPAEELPLLVDRALGVLLDPPDPQRLRPRDLPGRSGDAWASVLLTRRERRAGVRDLLRYGGSATVRLRGATIVAALTRLDGQPCVLAGQDREQRAPMGPAALREARRAMRLAEELGLPLVTVVDTAGAELSREAEEGAIAGEIARCIATLTTLTVPTVSVLLGQGCGGGALALLPADTVIAAEHSWLSPLPPEGASVIVHGDQDHAAEVARSQKIGAGDLVRQGIAHRLVAEVPGEPVADFALAVVAEIATALAEATGRRGRALRKGVA